MSFQKKLDTLNQTKTNLIFQIKSKTSQEKWNDVVNIAHSLREVEFEIRLLKGRFNNGNKNG